MAMFYTSSMIGMLYHDVVNTSVYSVELQEPPSDDGAEKRDWNHRRLCRPEQLLAASVSITIFFFACMRMLHAHDGHGIFRLFDCTCSSRAVISDQVRVRVYRPRLYHAKLMPPPPPFLLSPPRSASCGAWAAPSSTSRCPATRCRAPP